jgi:hypothetical protein
MGVDVSDDFAGKMKGGGDDDDEKDRNSQQMTTIGSPPFCYIFLSRVFSSYFNGRQGKKKKENLRSN